MPFLQHLVDPVLPLVGEVQVILDRVLILGLKADPPSLVRRHGPVSRAELLPPVRVRNRDNRTDLDRIDAHAGPPRHDGVHATLDAAQHRFRELGNQVRLYREVHHVLVRFVLV